jgi:hypothetical protein
MDSKLIGRFILPPAVTDQPDMFLEAPTFSDLVGELFRGFGTTAFEFPSRPVFVTIIFESPTSLVTVLIGGQVFRFILGDSSV